MRRMPVKTMFLLVETGAAVSMLALSFLLSNLTGQGWVLPAGALLTACALFWLFLLTQLFAKRLSQFTSGLCQTMDSMITGSQEPARAEDRETIFARISYRLSRLYSILQENRRKVDEERRELQELVSDISHQVKTPVANLKMVTDEPFIVRGISQEDMAEMYAGDAVLDGTADYQQLLDGDGILVCPSGGALKEIYRTSYQIGDTVTVSCYNGQSKTYTVMGIVQDAKIGSSTHFFILPEEKLPVLYPEISDFTGYVNLHTEQDSDQLRRAVFSAVSDQRVAVSGLDDLSAELERGLRGELARDYGILVFIFVFSLINLANTLITNLLTRQQEFGVFQSVGMSDRQLSNMLSFECLYYVGITLLVTLTLGTACSLVVCKVFDQIGLFGTLTYHFPVLQVLLFGTALLLVQGVFSVCAVRYTRRLSLVERIKAVD